MSIAAGVCFNRAMWHLVPPTAADAATEPTGDDVQLLAVTNDDELDQALRDYLGIKLPNLKCCERHATPWQALHDAFFARAPISVWKGSRGMAGKTHTLAALSMAEALFLRADVNILGGSGVQSQRVLESMGRMWDHPGAPRNCLRGSEPSSVVQKMVWGNSIKALMASQKSVRGPHPQRLRLDEVDEMKIPILDAALGQPMSKGWILSHVVLSSTHQYPDGTFTEVLRRAKTQGWPFYEWCYRETLEPHGWLSMYEVERKRAILTKAMWDTEIEGQEPSSEGRAFDTPKIEAAFQPIDQIVEGTKELTIIEAPVEGAKYGTGGDWAKKKNWTVIVTMRHDVKPAKVVCIRRTQKRPWPDMVKDLDDQAKAYGGTVCHDNTGLGQVVHDLITVGSEPFDMIGRQRAELLSEYIASVEKGEVVWPRNEQLSTPLEAAYSEHKYATRDDIYKGGKDSSTKFHLPDTISAAALAWRACGGVEAGSVVKQPDEKDHPHLQAGVQRGRLSGYIRAGVRELRTDDDDETEQ